MEMDNCEKCAREKRTKKIVTFLKKEGYKEIVNDGILNAIVIIKTGVLTKRYFMLKK